MEARCPRCGAELPADAAVCPTCAYGDVEDIVILEAQPPGAAQARSESANPSALPRILGALAFLVVVVAVIFAAVR